MNKLTLALLFFSLMGFSYNSFGGDPVAGEKRYGESCINCHGPAGKGAASYPKISGKEISYVTAMLCQPSSTTTPSSLELPVPPLITK